MHRLVFIIICHHFYHHICVFLDFNYNCWVVESYKRGLSPKAKDHAIQVLESWELRSEGLGLFSSFFSTRGEKNPVTFFVTSLHLFFFFFFFLLLLLWCCEERDGRTLIGPPLGFCLWPSRYLLMYLSPFSFIHFSTGCCHRFELIN